MLADAVTTETLNNLQGRFQAPIKSSIAKLRRQRISAATEPSDVYLEQQARDKRIAQSKLNPVVERLSLPTMRNIDNLCSPVATANRSVCV